MRNFLRDARYAIRSILKSPSVAVICILTLALGIGANTAIFSVVDAALLRPLSYHDSDRLAMIYESDPAHGWPQDTPAPANFQDWRNGNHTLTGMAAFTDEAFNFTGRGEPERLIGYKASASLFPILGVQPAIGRAFNEQEDKPGADSVVVLSNGLWMRRFNGDRGVLGKTLALNDKHYTVVGVMPPNFSFPYRRAELWIPIAFSQKQLQNRGSHFLNVVGRIRNNSTLKQARRDLDVIGSQLAQAYPATNTGVGVAMERLQDSYVGNTRPALIVLLAAVGFVLLIACANVANLLLARSAGRRREVAIRVALGAGKSRLIAQLLTESVLLAITGGALGLGFAVWGVDALRELIPPTLLNVSNIGIDARVLVFTMLLSLATGILFGLAPALTGSHVDLQDSLKDGGRSASEGLRRNRIRSLLVVSEVALALMLLIAAGLMIRSFQHLRNVDAGYRADHLLTMRLTMPQSRYGESQKRTEFFDQLLPRLESLPGVQSAAVISVLPNTFKGNSSFVYVEGRAAPAPGKEPFSNVRVINPGYLKTMGIPLLKGRVLAASDTSQSPAVVIVNETLAKRLWPNEDPLGKRFTIGHPESGNPWRTVAGIVRDIRQNGLDEAPRAETYVPYWQWSGRFFEPKELAIRTSVDPVSVASAVRGEIHRIDADQAIYDIRTMEDIHAEDVAQPHFQVLLLAGFGGLALALAAIGIYGVMSYSVAQRTNEIGIRVALGADRTDILGMVMKQTALLASAGIAIGIAGALAAARSLKALLFGIEATDPITFVVVPVLLLAIAMLASYVPAWRATRVDPITALRYE